MSDPEKAGTVEKPLEDGELGDIEAPVKKEASEETSEDEIKARILGDRAEEGKETKMSGYSTKQMVKILSDKAEEKDKKKMKILSEKAEECNGKKTEDSQHRS